MSRPTAVVTGAAGGLGRATARRLHEAGYDVVAVTRDARGETPDARRRLHADLLVRAEITALAGRLRDTVARVDVLVNNAGAAFPHFAETVDGVERTHALNHLAPFQLTHLLLADGLLAADARIITIASDLVTRGRLASGAPDVTGVSWRDRYSQLTVYGTAKLAAALATAALARRLPPGMHAYSANPGVVKTGFNAKAGGLLRVVSGVSGLFAASPDKAAATPVTLATAATAAEPNGGFFTRNGAAARPVLDPALAEEVYTRTADELAR